MLYPALLAQATPLEGRYLLRLVTGTLRLGIGTLSPFKAYHALYPPEAPAPEDDATAQLQNLAALHTQGVLTNEEFAAAKAKILGI